MSANVNVVGRLSNGILWYIVVFVDYFLFVRGVLYLGLAEDVEFGAGHGCTGVLCSWDQYADGYCIRWNTTIAEI